MKDIASGTAIMLPYTVNELTGTVISETTRSETEVSGHIPSGNSNRGGHISSRTTRYQTIYLKDDEGIEHATELVDMIVSCREGQLITLWGINGGWWFEGYNHTTRQSSTGNKTLGNFSFPKKLIWRLVGAYVLITFLILYNAANATSDMFLGVIGIIITSLLFALIIVLLVGLPIQFLRSSEIRNQLKQNMTAIT